MLNGYSLEKKRKQWSITVSKISTYTQTRIPLYLELENEFHYNEDGRPIWQNAVNCTWTKIWSEIQIFIPTEVYSHQIEVSGTSKLINLI